MEVCYLSLLINLRYFPKVPYRVASTALTKEIVQGEEILPTNLTFV